MILTGLQFSLSRLLSFLKTGGTSTNFSSSGNITFSRQSLAKAAKFVNGVLLTKEILIEIILLCMDYALALRFENNES